MPSKKSKATKLLASRSKDALCSSNPCSETELFRFGEELGRALAPGDRILLEGPMGAGKSTLARAILVGAGVSRDSEGSPTFPIAHEYAGKEGLKLVHVDFYRLRSEVEIEETGLLEAFWDPSLAILSEWTSEFPQFRASLLGSEFPCGEIRLEFVEDRPDLRRLVCSNPFP